MRPDANRIPAKFSVLSRPTPARDKQAYLTAPLGEAATRKTWTAEGENRGAEVGRCQFKLRTPRWR